MASFKIPTNKLIAARLMGEAPVSAALFGIMTCKQDVVPKQVAVQDNAALSEILICRLPAVRVLIAEVALQAAPQVNVVSFKTLTDKHTVAQRLAEVKVNAASYATMIYRLCAAPKQVVALVSAALSEIPTCRLPAALKQDNVQTR